MMDAMITAGGTLAPDDPLYALTHLQKKALIPLAGQPMICWIIDALRGAGVIDHIVIVGLKPEELPGAHDRLHFTDAVGDIVDNIFAGLARLRQVNPLVKKFLLVSSDIPLITPATVQGFIQECGTQEADIYYAMVEEKTMESAFPNSKRTFIPFKGGRYSGGDIFLLDVNAAKANIALAKAGTGARKNYLRQIQFIGLGFIIRFLLRRMTIHEAAKHVSAKANLNGRVIDTRFAEVGMDLDKVRHYEIIKAHLEKRQARVV